jgi:protein-tyrosine phosphatase
MDADEVTWITDSVAITNFFSAHSKAVLTEHKVKAVLCLDRELQGSPPGDRGIDCVRVMHMKDGPNEMRLFKEAVATLERLLADYNRVVVHCRAGRSRSIAVVAAYLMKARDLGADEALAFVMAKRAASIAPELVELVERFGA